VPGAPGVPPTKALPTWEATMTVAPGESTTLTSVAPFTAKLLPANIA